MNIMFACFPVASGQVEMIGTDGPGDKLFRLISDTYNAPSYHDHMLDPRSGVFESHDSFGVPPMSDSLDGSILGRFRGFPRDEGSQLDKVTYRVASLQVVCEPLCLTCAVAYCFSVFTEHRRDPGRRRRRGRRRGACRKKGGLLLLKNKEYSNCPL
jgi:hypothetical protein